MGEKLLKKMFSILNHQEKANQNFFETHHVDQAGLGLTKTTCEMGEAESDLNLICFALLIM